MKYASTVLLLLSFFIISCSEDFFFQMFIPKEADAFARNYITLLRSGEIDTAISLLDPQLQTQGTEWLKEVSKLLVQGEIKSTKIIGSNVLNTPDRTRTGLTYEFEYSNEWLLVEMVVDRVNNANLVTGLHTYHLTQSLEELNKFTLSGKGFLHFFVLLVTVSVFAFSLFVLFLCIRMKLEKKWAWILFILIGVGKVGINWSNGLFDYQIINFQILSAAIMKNGPYAPWFLSFSIPLGAIVFLFKRKRLGAGLQNQSSMVNNSIAIVENDNTMNE